MHGFISFVCMRCSEILKNAPRHDGGTLKSELKLRISGNSNTGGYSRKAISTGVYFRTQQLLRRSTTLHRCNVKTYNMAAIAVTERRHRHPMHMMCEYVVVSSLSAQIPRVETSVSSVSSRAVPTWRTAKKL